MKISKEQEVCPESPEMETESQNEENKEEQLIEEDSGKKGKKEKNYNKRLLKLHVDALVLANQVGLSKKITSQTEAEPLGMCDSSPLPQIEIQDQQAQDGPLLEKSSESEENCEVVAEDVVPDTQERPAQSEKEISDENKIEILSESDEGDKEEEGGKKKNRGSCLRRVLLHPQKTKESKAVNAAQRAKLQLPPTPLCHRSEVEVCRRNGNVSTTCLECE
ncbi:Hypothetical predicted protein [Pelobates cultripes]|uniref:Uncharacterized protein n=1 Tax=Pelobates cultripes TaxID=61616 RepID=A0AAD1W921_PELCU|nr:Hypothetical predicted protein [Pelobates cultripes]